MPRKRLPTPVLTPATRDEIAAVGLVEAVSLMTPDKPVPRHLHDLCELLELAETHPVRAVVAMPPRHAKTHTICHAIAWWLARSLECRIGYVTHSQRLSDKSSRMVRRLVENMGVPLVQSQVAHFITESDGSMFATAVDGSITGMGFHRLIIDDPIKNREVAESANERDRIYDAFTDDMMTRLEPGGSCVVVATRWHEDDLSGRLLAAGGWRSIILPAVDESTGTPRALWPDRWPLETMLQIRRGIGERTWWSLYQGKPRPPSGSLFGEPVWCEEVAR